MYFHWRRFWRRAGLRQISCILRHKQTIEWNWGMKLSSSLLLVEKSETSSTCRIHWILCCPLSVSYRSHIRTGHRHQECLHFKEEAAMLLYASQPRETGKNISYKNLVALAFPFVIPLHRIFYELSLFWTASGSLPIVSRTPAFCIIVVVKQQYIKYFRYAAGGSPVTTCRVLSLGWRRVCRCTCIQPWQVDWQWVSSRGQLAVGGSEVMGLGVKLTAPYIKKVSRSLCSRGEVSCVLRGRRFLKSKVYRL